MEKRKSSILIRFILRAILGLVVIFGVNQFLDYRNIPVSVGINLISFLTSGTLGIPGVCLLYGIMFYQIM
ncbi:pro-sigmaK processing inhibitor BofA family protein [bacterium]|uniref:pro-sigmaK processing inhibitor BofA family protein n=1 Tax=Lachnospiraceae TaxID=186803 RepID=UPI002A2569A3|nr:pro-sigmaK processing inhibitor BofA family protein [bacterium]MDY2885971.1 pro-sigmaK processing inhibitor BofA family protein [Bariatricus sp.]MCI7150541.1 pro-sigmaK processing inhibitor BofA family protein [bacterium]MDD6515192.1 pro-sigmaK processing inhibitor BofA family protein [bacterium]MDD7143154.1 pro-sigmaK processing inhibitor BofA family protein [bacterium]